MKELSIDLTPEEKKENKRKLRQAEEHKLRLKKLAKKAVYWLATAFIVFGIVWWIINQFPKGPNYSVAFPLLGREHIAEGVVYQNYNSNPPTSGPHYANPAIPKFYNEPLPDEQIVHNLEHGHIWVTYRPTVSQEIIAILKKFAGNNIIVTPRSANDFDIALIAWGRLDKFNIKNGQIDTQRIKNFILRYQNRGPENESLTQPLR